MKNYYVEYVKRYTQPTTYYARAREVRIQAKDITDARLKIIQKGDYKKYPQTEILAPNNAQGMLVEVKLVSSSVWPKAKPLSNGNYLIWVYGDKYARKYSYVDPKSGRLVDSNWNWMPDDKRLPVRRVR